MSGNKWILVVYLVRTASEDHPVKLRGAPKYSNESSWNWSDPFGSPLGG